MSDKKEFTVEQTFRASPAILFKFLTTPSGLVQWFADHVDKTGDKYSFFWNGAEERAEVTMYNENELLKMQWEDEDEYILYRIDKSEVTGETILFVTDFAEEDEMDDQIQLWESQLEDLAKCMGG
ncbi:MAG: START-like domain-containing protein [Chitinophagales bacterium]